MQLIPGPLGYKRRIKKVGKWGLDLIKQEVKTRLEISISPQGNDTDDDVFVLLNQPGMETEAGVGEYRKPQWEVDF